VAEYINDLIFFTKLLDRISLFTLHFRHDNGE
jgi:hypothetical protein